jgi:hypothetical protein
MLTAWALSKNRCEVVGEMKMEQVAEDLDISSYGSDEDRYLDWDE